MYVLKPYCPLCPLCFQETTVASVDFCTIDGSLIDWWICKLGYDTSIYADTGSGNFLKEILYLLVPGSIFPYRNMKALFQGRKEVDFQVLLSTVCHQCYTCLTTCSLPEFSCFYKSNLRLLSSWAVQSTTSSSGVTCSSFCPQDYLGFLLLPPSWRMISWEWFPCTSPFFMAFICLIAYRDHSLVVGICKL